jgi:solute carrier family 25 phosphate transporter 3
MSNIVELAKQNVFASPFASKQLVNETQQKRQIAFAAAAGAPAAPGEVAYGSAQFYALCAVGGALSCGLTHTAVVPLDLVKCRIQVDPAKYKSIGTAFSVTMAEEGARGLLKGWAPTLIGYSIQGLGKFGFYEAFKILYGNMLGEVRIFYYLNRVKLSSFICFLIQTTFFENN